MQSITVLVSSGFLLLAVDYFLVFVFCFFIVLNRQERQTQSCACPLDRENLIRNEVSYLVL